MIAIGIIVSGMGNCPNINPAPPPHQTSSTQPPVRESTIVVPFQSENLNALAAMLNDPNAVPTGKDGEGAWGDVGQAGLWDKVSWHRDNFSVSASDNSIYISTTVHYSVRLAHELGGTRVQFAQCGHGEPEASFNVGIHATLTPQADWSLVSAMSLVGPVTGTPCNLGGIGPLTYNASDKIAGLIRNLLNGKMSDIQNRINSQLAFKDRAAVVWSQLQSPVALGSDTYFVASLTGANLSPLTASNNTLSISGGISGLAKIVVGAPAVPNPSPLPPLQIISKPSGFHIELPIAVSYDRLSSEVDGRLRGHMYPFADHSVTITSVSVYGTSDKLVLQLDVKLSGVGTARVYLVGTPQYDALRRVVSASHLQYTLETTNALINVADWFLHSEFLSIIEGEAHYAIGDQVDSLRVKANTAVNRQIGPHADLSGSVTDISLTGFSISPSAITAHFETTGTATVTLH
jgi:hypothetical protein